METIALKEYVLSEPNGWIDLYTAPKFSSNGRQFLMILPTSQGEFGNYKHLVLYDRDTKTVRALTSGRWEVTEILNWNEATATACVTIPIIFHNFDEIMRIVDWMIYNL